MKSKQPQFWGSRWVEFPWFKVYRRVLVFLCLVLLGLVSVLCAPVLSAQQIKSIAEATSQPFTTQSLLQQGTELYEAERFVEAAAVWEQALAEFLAQDNHLNQALVLSRLALAYQQLGQWQQAEEAINQAIALIYPARTALSQSQETPFSLQVLANVLNTQGRLQWVRGQLEDALQSWQQAATAYAQAEDETGVIIASINRATALQALGFAVQAEEQLEQIYQRLQQQSNSQLKAVGLRSLGAALRRVGKLNESRSVLQESLVVSEATNRSAITGSILLELGNTERAFSEKAIAIGNLTEAEIYQEAALRFYQQAAIAASSQSLKLQAQLNWLSFLVNLKRWSAATELANIIEPALDHLPASRSTVYAQLSFAKSLMALNAREITHHRIAQRLAAAIAQSRYLNDPIAESYAVGQLGELYQSIGQWTDAQRLTEQALFQAESAQAADVRYRWEWQLGRILKHQWELAGKRSPALLESAIAAYTASVESLKSIRNDLLLIGSDIQFSFRDDVEPVYRELVELLLTTEDGATPTQANLRQAIQQVDALQLAELKNFLGCDIAQTVELQGIEISTAAKLYPMILPNRLAVVLELPGQPLAYSEQFQSRQEVESTLQQLRQNLSESDRTPDAIAGLQNVYQWLILPFKPLLENNQISTLVFVPDGQLRNIPMAALYDGEQYLIRRYAIALSPRLELFAPTPRPNKLNVFLGGIGEPQTINNRRFSSIENLVPELVTIEQLVDAKPPLLNGEFTETNLEQQLKSGNFSAIHLKTHGVFSSDPEETFIVAYQELITSRDLGRLIQSSRAEVSSPIELLVLSACSTAQGDNRAVLGLAGVAVQAGARSVVSTLWQAQDIPNTELMIRFYQELTDPTITRAQALRMAQLYLIDQGYRTPHVWATYVLVGNWL